MGTPPCYLYLLIFVILEDGEEFIAADDDITSNVSCQYHPLLEDDDHFSEDLEHITANINACHVRSHQQYQISDDNPIEQLDAQMYCFSLPVSSTEVQLAHHSSTGACSHCPTFLTIFSYL